MGQPLSTTMVSSCTKLIYEFKRLSVHLNSFEEHTFPDCRPYIFIWIGNSTFTYNTNYDGHAKNLSIVSVDLTFSPHLFMNIDIPSEDDGVLTAASDDRIEATFSFRFWAFSLQAIFVQNKLFLFLFLIFSHSTPLLRICNVFLLQEILWNCLKQSVRSGTNHTFETTTTRPWPKNSKTTKNPNVMMDGCVCECTLFIYNKSSLFASFQSSPLPFQDQIFNGCKHRSTNILPNSEIDFKQIVYSLLHIHWNFRYVSILITETTTI